MSYEMKYEEYERTTVSPFGEISGFGEITYGT